MKAGKVAAIALVVLGAYVAVMILRSIVDPQPEGFCHRVLTNTYPSPNGAYTVVDEFTRCGESSFKRTLLLQEGAEQSGSFPVIYSSELQTIEHEGYTISPPPVGVRWLGIKSVSISITDKSRQHSDQTNVDGISVEFVEIFP